MHVAEMKVLSAEAMKPALDELLRDPQRVLGSIVTVAYATAGMIANRIRAGEAADVAIIPRSVFDALVTEGRILTDTVAKVGQSVLGAAVPTGAPRPDIDTVAALKRTLLAAKSITYPDPARGGAIGIEAARVVERLGLTAQLRPKTILTAAGEFRQILAERRAEFAFVQPIVVANYFGIELLGALPSELQASAALAFFGGVSADAKNPAAAKALMRYLVSPAAIQVMRDKGME